MFGPEVTRRLPVYDNLRITYAQGLCMFFLGCVSIGYNFARKIPIRPSLPRHVLVAFTGLYPGKLVDDFQERRRNMRVLIIEDYISKHPEDFPLETPKKYKDLLLPWTPVR